MSIKPERSEQREEWHKAKIFSVAHLLATLAAISGGIGFVYVFGQEFGVMKSDVARNKVEIRYLQESQTERENQLNAHLSSMRVEQKQDLQRIEDKVDRLIDRELRK